MDPPIPSHYIIGEVLGHEDSFFSSVAQGLEQVKGGKYSAKMLRHACKKFADSYSALQETIADQSIRDYIAHIEYCTNECQTPILGRPDVEGRIINKVFNVKIYVTEKQGSDNSPGGQERQSWIHKILDESGYRNIECIDYEVPEAIYIINKGGLHFKPILKNIVSQASDKHERGNAEMQRTQILEDQNGENETFEIRAGTSGAGGHFYEIKLLMLYLLRLQETDNFYIARNMAGVGAFDDVVFKYQGKDKDGVNTTKTIFLQAKHGEKSEPGYISSDSLLSAKGAFSLKKYFESYQEIKQNFQTSTGPIFNGEFSDSSFIIFTNYRVESSSKNDKDTTRWMKKEADRFVISKGNESYRININADINQDIIQQLSRNPIQQLAQQVYDYILGTKKHVGIKAQNEIFQEYQIYLANEVFTVNKNKPSDSKFRKTFIKGNNLWNKMYQIANNSDEMKNISEDEFEVKLNESKVNLFKAFGNYQLTLDATKSCTLVTDLTNRIRQNDNDLLKIDEPSEDIMQLANNALVRDEDASNANTIVKFCTGALEGQTKKFMEALQKKLAENPERDHDLTKIRFEIEGFPRFSLLAPDEDVAEEVKQFLSKLEFVASQHNENELDDIINEEIRKLHRGKNEDIEIIFQSVKTQVESWWKSDNIFLTKRTQFVKNAQASISHFYLNAWDKLNKRGIEITGIQFKETALNEMQTIIDQKQVLNIVAEIGTTLLSSVKVCQTLDQNLGGQSYIFVQLNHLLYIQDHALQIFQTDGTRHFIVIENNQSYEKEYKWPEQDFAKLYDKLYEIIRTNKGKKVVLVTEADDMLANYFKNDKENFRKESNNINLNHLTIPSQKKLMETEVMLHGKSIKVGDLVDFQNENANSAITSQTILSLITGDNIIISNAPPTLGDLDAAYTKLYEKMPKETLVRELRTSPEKNTIFVISGIKKPRSGTLHDKLIKILQIADADLARDLRQMICLYGERTDDKTIIIIANAKAADPLKVFRQICSSKSDKIIYWIEMTGKHARLQQVFEPNFYIKRNFDYVENFALNLELMLQEDHATQLVWNNTAGRTKVETIVENFLMKCQRQLKQKCENEAIISANSESRAENEYVGPIDANSYIHVSHKTGTVHWLQMIRENGHLAWKRSHGSLEYLQKYIEERKTERKFYAEKDFNKEIKDKVVIIADEPGMGKTTSLTSISQQMLDDNWIIRINLLDCKGAIETLPTADLDFEDVYNFIEKVECSGVQNNLAKQLMLYNLDPKEHRCRPIIFMFDGYDEISIDDHEKILPLLQFIKWQTSAKLWVTTRPHLMDDLENGLSALAVKFKPLELEEQKEFLNRFWRIRLAPLLRQENIEEKIGIYSSKLLQESSDILGETISQIMGVPLQLRLLAEGQMRDIVNYLNGSNVQHPKFDNLNVMKVFQNFIDAKYEIYVTEKMRLGKTAESIKNTLNSGFDKHHETSAMHLLFPENDCLLNPKSLAKLKRNDFKSVGIMQSVGKEGKPYFIHRTFAEYFSAKLLVRYLDKKETNPTKYNKTTTFLSKHIFEEWNNVIREFIDHMLSEGFPIHIATLGNKLRDVMELTKDLTQQKAMDNMGRTALHLAAYHGHFNIVKVLLDNGYDAVSSDALGKTSLHYATMNGHEKVVEHLLNCNADIDIVDNVFATPLHVDMEVGINIFSDENARSSLVTFVNEKDIQGKTAFSYATEIKNWNIACALISHGANINFTSTKHKKKLISHVIEKLNHTYYIDILGILLINYPGAVYFENIKHDWDMIMGTFIVHGHLKVLHAITAMSSNACFEIVESLATNLKLYVNCSDEDNVTVAKYLFGKCNNKSLIRNLGVSAARRGNLETLKYTLKQEKTYDLQDHMLEAIEQDRQNIVMYLFENYSKYITTDILKTALYTAVNYNRLGIIQYLVGKGANANARYEGKTLFHYAASQHFTNVMQYLVKMGVRSSIAGELGYPIEDYVEMCLTYYKYESMENDVMDNLNRIAEICPLLNGLTDSEKVAHVILSIVENDVTCRNEHGTTLLHIAAAFQNTSFANYLIDRGADINIKDREGRTPLHTAVQAYCKGARNNKAITLLLQHAAIYDEKDEYNATVLDYFSESQTSNGPVFKLLNLINMLFKNFPENFETIVNPKLKFFNIATILSNGAKNSSGNTALHLSAACGNIEMVSMFIKNGCPFNSCNNENNTPKDLAQKNRHKNVVEIIETIENAFTAIKNKKEFEIEQILKEFRYARDEHGKTMLHWAAEYGNVGIANVLIQDKVFKDEKDNLGWTPLHYAAKNDQIEIIKLLLNHCAIFNPKNRDKMSPLQVATGKSFIFLEHVNKMYKAIQFESPEIANGCLKSMQRDNHQAFVAAINCIDNFGNKLLNYVTAANDTELVILLLQNGAAYDELSKWGVRSEHNVCGREIAKLLKFIDELFKWERRLIYSHNAIEQCPTKLQLIQNCRDRRGNNILHRAAEHPVNHCRLKFFVKHGVDINAYNKDGYTVLDVAIEKMNLDLVKFLLKNNVNVHKLAPDNNRKLMKRAAVRERHDIVDLFNSLEKV